MMFTKDYQKANGCSISVIGFNRCRRRHASSRLGLSLQSLLRAYIGRYNDYCQDKSCWLCGPTQVRINSPRIGPALGFLCGISSVDTLEVEISQIHVTAC